MTPRTYDVGVIPCTSRKRPGGLTPVTLYMGGPFSLMMRHAAQRCRKVIIMSAKYGFIELTAPVRWYEAYLPKLAPHERRLLLDKLREQAPAQFIGKSVLWYPSQVYFDALVEATPTIAAGVTRPYKTLPSLVLYKVLSNEIKCYDSSPSRR